MIESVDNRGDPIDPAPDSAGVMPVSKGAFQLTVRIRDLGDVYREIANGLQNLTGITAVEKLNAMRALTLGCPKCGVALSGDDLRQIASSRTTASTVDGRLNRLREGSCSSVDCPSRFYTLDFLPFATVDWGIIVQSLRTSDCVASDEAEEQMDGDVRTENWRDPSTWRKRWIWVALVAFGALALIAYKIRTPEWAGAEGKFQLAPAEEAGSSTNSSECCGAKE